MTLGNVIFGSTDLDSLVKDNFKVDITQGSVGKPYDKCLVLNSLCTDNGVVSLVVDGLTIRDLK